MLARFASPGAAVILPRYQGFIDPEGRWTAWYWSEHGISYNTSLVPKDKAPTGWNDLCNPFFKGNVSYDPGEDRYLAGLSAMFGVERAERLLKMHRRERPDHPARPRPTHRADAGRRPHGAGRQLSLSGHLHPAEKPVGPLCDRLFGAGLRVRRRRRHQQECPASLRRGALGRLGADQREPDLRGLVAAWTCHA